MFLNNNRTAKVHSEFVDKAITELCSADRVIEVFDRPHVINPLCLGTV